MIKTTKEKTILENKFFKVSNNEVLFNNDHKGEHLLIEGSNQSDGIAVLPILADGSIILIKNYRYAAEEWLYQVPKGGNGTKFKSIDDAIKCAEEEMEEEISYKSKNIKHLYHSYESPSIMKSNLNLLIAFDCEYLENSKEKEKTEVIDEVIIVKKENIEEFIKDKKTCASTLFLIEKYLRIILEEEIKELKRNK